MINANVKLMTFLTKLVIDNMVVKDTKCAVINVGSETATFDRTNTLTTTNYQIYRASKAYQFALI